VNASFWHGYDPQCKEYERELPTVFPWQQPVKEDQPRYVKGGDGYWYAPEQKDTGKALLRLVGDLMCEPAMCRRNRYGDSYFFHPCFQYVRGLLKDTDLTLGNLETTVTDLTPYAGQYHVIPKEPTATKFQYHCNGPESYLEALRYAGFDVLVNGNNHNCDSGIMGLWQTLDRLDAHDFLHTGTFRPSDDRVLLIRVNGIRLAVLSYGSRYNDLDRMWTQKGVDTWLNYFNKEKVIRDVEYARSKGAEYVIAYIHWGKDYDMEPNEKQLAILPELADTGVDYIVGSHTHCLQKYERIQNSRGETVPVMFSMGNFVTNETKELCKHTGILQLELTRRDSHIQVEERFIPCYVFDEFGTGRYCVVPAEPKFSGEDTPKLRQVKAYVADRIGPGLPEPQVCSASLEQLCRAMELPPPEGSAYVPVMGLATGYMATDRGYVYFARGDENRQEKLAVVKNRVAAVVSETPWEEMDVLLCEDVKAAWQRACAWLRPRCLTQVIAITGSRGKTLTKQLLCHALSQKYRVLTHPDSLQVDTGIWMNAMAHHDYCVMELRDSDPMGLSGLLSAIRPDAVLCTDDFAPGQGPHLPFDWQKACLGGVAEFVKDLGIPEPFAGFPYMSNTQNILQCKGVTVVYDLACRDVEAVWRTAQKCSGRKLYMGILPKKHPEADIVWDAASMTEWEREQVILETLQEGDVLILCGGRELDLDVTLRRLFGLSDGYIRGGR